VRWLRPELRLDAGSAEVAILLVGDARAPTARGEVVDDLDAHTPAGIPLLALDLAEVGDAAADAVPGADLVLLHASCRVPAEWLRRLRDAALSDDTIGTATPLSSWWLPVPGTPGREPDGAVAAASARARPRLQIGGPDCLYIRRRALSLIGAPARDVADVSRLIARICQAVVAAGLVNVVADDVYIDGSTRDPPVEPDVALDPLRAVDRGDERGALQRAVALGSAAIGGLTVTVDARSLNSAFGGTQRYTLELIEALVRYTDATVRAVVPADLAPAAQAILREAPGVQLVTYEQAVAGVPESHIVHRPQQVFGIGDLNLLRLLGRRLVVTHQDLIAYHNPTYHADADAWEQYRRITRIALAVADRVVLFSEHARREVLAEDLVVAERCDVVGAAVAERSGPAPRAPGAVARDRDFILCLGADYRHKNRVFALRIAQVLRAQHGWEGQLVLAGAHVPNGSSADDERQLLAAHPELAPAVVDVGGVDEAQRRWLLAHTRAVLVPSVVEGFGLVPLEAAQAGVPCLFAAPTSLGEVVSPELATLVPWEPAPSAARIVPLLADGTARREHVDRLRADAARWSWERLAAQLVATYERALGTPYRAAATRAWQEAEREAHLVRVHSDYHRLLNRVDGRIALASDEGFLTAREQRGLLRVGARPALARAVLWPFSVLGSIRAPTR
jgi:glycosyltransferase involved in cell wall biosynthesis